jgi:membrane-associated phospholipid phosphatase
VDGRASGHILAGLRVSRGIRVAAWTLVAAGVAAPVIRRRAKLQAPLVLGSAGLAPLALCVAVRRSRARDIAVCVLNMWAYVAAYEMPHDDPAQLERRVLVDYPIAADRALGLGVIPTVRLQRAFAAPGTVNRFERTLVWCHWLWFATPHASVAYVLLRRPERFPAAAARMYAVFDLGAVFYWSIPTAPPWWAAAQGRLEDGEPIRVRRMMIEYGERFWGARWERLFGLLGGNPLAAMPSLHFATSLMGAHLLSEVGTGSAVVGWTYVAGLGLALVYLGEHYLIDLVGGALLTESIRRIAPLATPLARHIADGLDGLAWVRG